MTKRPDTRRAVRTRENRRRFGSMRERATEAVQVLYLTGGTTAADLAEGLGWPAGITGGVLTYLQQQKLAVRLSGGETVWVLTDAEQRRQHNARARG